MKQVQRSLQMSGCLALLLAGGLSWSSAFAAAPAAEASPLGNIKVDNRPLPPEIKSRTSFSTIAKRVAPSVVNVYSTRKVQEKDNPVLNDPFLRRFFGGGDDAGGNDQPQTEQGLGSGVVVTADGYIITNNHVVENSTDIRVGLAGGQEYPAKVVGTDPATDVAVLKINATGLPAITLGNSTNLDVGDTVLAIGNPFGIGQTVTMGIVSGTGRSGFGIVNYEDFIQTDASINPGNSGGALIDMMGRLIGINTAILSRSGGNQGVGFAVPIDMARYVMDQIILHGQVVRGYLGIEIQPLTPQLAEAFHVKGKEGALVASVRPNSPAAKAGLKEGDVVTEFNGSKVVDSRHLQLMVSQTAPNTQATLQVLHNGQPEQVRVKLGELANQELADARGQSEPAAHQGRGGAMAGMQLSELDAQMRRELKLPSNVEGLVVTSVDPGSEADRAGVRPGDVIEQINKQPVRGMSDLKAARTESKAGSLLLRVWSNGGSHFVALETGTAEKK